MTDIAVPPGRSAAPLDESLTDRALDIAVRKTTEMADSTLAVPLSYYRDPALYERELALLKTTPLAIGQSAQLTEPHAYFVRTVLGSSLLVTRDADGKAHVFLNYCRHRGARPAEGEGVARRFTCPYHAWSYDSKGCLASFPGRAGFPNLDKSRYGLVELPSQERHGFVWAVLTAGAPLDLDAHLGPLDAELAQWRYQDYGYLTAREFTSGVSWKGALEAFAEGYHFPFVHGESVIGQNTLADTSIHDTFGRHHRMGFPFNWITALADAPGEATRPDRTPSANMGIIYWIYPNLILANSMVGVEIIDMLPHDAPTTCTVRHSWMGVTPATDEVTTAMYQDVYEQVHAAVRDEDFLMLPSCGDGVRNGQHDHMLIGRNEIGVQHMIRTMADVLDIALDTDRL
ncbi:Phenylpropionate dioxygenase, large terminal subunit [Thermomonospora echinospora]|uniref:Phenylpropionate dioxygenase, large terminal subunit n=1 Tax=Thermomonospora echinospora TaxID=1992 RepID=A0A1H6E7A8_9ACTN|nr:aromatic ring-hydroxylating dioxygenase subunit alpha [Thermomonospora echinospora]SEG92824.1 Phenylpropionate dioxygenase, large terminal subunit [Thermomonospora echinospora]